MIQKYKIEFPEIYYECNVEIDEEFVIASRSTPGLQFTTAMAIKEMVDFWADSEDELDGNGGDYTKTFLQYLGRAAMLDGISENHNLLGVLSYFEENEGWYPMDGSYGIKITYVEELEFSNDQFQVEEVPNE